MPTLEAVFKTGGTPTHTFVRPTEYPALLVALRTPGRGLVIEGPSGIGKTTSVTKALEELGASSSVLSLSARKKGDIDLIKALPSMEAIETVLIDDFHRLDDSTKQELADFMKVLADEERKDSKLVFLGINRAGESLVRFAHDLNNRLEIIRLEANPDSKVRNLIEQGENALGITINVVDEIVEAANGSFYIAQMLSHQVCLDSGILESQPLLVATHASFELSRGKVFDRLSRSFMERTRRFARGTRFRPEGRAPYLHLLYWLATSRKWSLDVNKTLLGNPSHRGSITQIVEKGYLLDLIKGDEEIAAVLHFDPHSRLLTVEDPQYIYFLRNMIWGRFAKETGFVGMEFPSRYDFALSFGRGDRDVAAALFASLEQEECEVFYDKNEQHRILAEDVEDYLRPIYQSGADFVIVLMGPEYPKRVWTRVESDSFKARLHEGSVIPILFSDASLGVFDESARLGRLEFDREGPFDDQVEQIAKTLLAKLCEKRGRLI